MYYSIKTTKVGTPTEYTGLMSDDYQAFMDTVKPVLEHHGYTIDVKKVDYIPTSLEEVQAIHNLHKD